MEGLAQTLRRVSFGVRGVANGDTEDVVQEAVARALRSGVSLEAEQWLRTVAKRVAIDQHRKRREVPSGGTVELERSAPAAEGTPEDAVILSERAEAVRDALATLPPRYRTALLAYAEEDSPADVANRLGMTAAATWTLLSRARSRLKLQLEQVGFVPAIFTGNPRIRALLAAGAAAGVATTMAVVQGPSGTPAPAPPPAKISQAVAIAPEAPAAEAVSSTGLLPVDTGQVTDTVEAALDELAPDVAAGVNVQTCLGRDPERVVGLEVSLVEEERTLVTGVVRRLPEPLRLPEVSLLCAGE